MRSGTMIVATSMLTLAALTASAHHGWDGYDDKKLVKVAGQIQSAGYENPHGTASLKTDSKTWHVVLAPPSRMTSRGLTKEMLADGTTATVEGYPHRSNEGEMRAERITIGGKTVELR